MRSPWRALALLLLLPALASAADVSDLVKRVKAVGREGAGNSEAAAAWKELSRRGTDAIVPLLGALDGASPVAANWLRSAVDAIVQRETAANRPLPVKDLEAFLRDTRHPGNARRLAFELICQADPAARERLLPTFLNDPGAELRFDAVAAAFAKAKALPNDSADAKDQLRTLLDSARDVAQTEEIAKELERRGSPVDLVKHYALITTWHLTAGFDNTDGKGFQAVYPPEQGVDIAGRFQGKDGKEISWKPQTTAEKTGAIDLNKALGKEKNSVAYALVVVESPVERPVEVRAASATAIKIWVNGKEVLAREVYHQSFEPDSHTAATTLKAGRNTVLVKVCQNNQTEDWAQNWMFQLRFTDSLGAGVPVKVIDPSPAAKEPK
jgi:hypothetical protein